MDRNYKSLELDKILELLAKESSCIDSKEQIKDIRPSFDISEVNKMLIQTSDAHMLIGRFGSPSFTGLCNVNNSLRRAQAGGTLTMGELLKISGILRIFRAVSTWRKKSESIKTELDIFFENINANKYFEDKIFNSILSEDEMADKASKELENIRRKIRLTTLKVRESLDKIIHSSKYQKYLQDPIVTIRSDRFVLPVKSEFKSEIKGLVHDTSSSGATVFIEPMSVVEINNEIRELKSKETVEIEKILTELSYEAGIFADNIMLSYTNSVSLDIIFSKAQLAYKMKASIPIMNVDGIVDLKNARHPLIDSNKVVPTNITLGIDFDTLVITGPNTGGKTVALKTLGLLTLMALCGLMIPASDNSRLCVFGNVLSDIGDEQSIEQSLSTFSAHMTNIIQILKSSSYKSLVLLDELGAGTDPIEGAALAIAILENLKYKGAKVVATTHYAEIKEFAIRTHRVENGCCEFDLKTLKPTYKLLIGVPGSSNAFAISSRLGLDYNIVERAKDLVSSENKRFEEVVKTLEKNRMELDEKRKEANLLNIKAQKRKQEAEDAMDRAKLDAKRYIDSAKMAAENLLDKTRRQADAILEELEELRKKKDNIDIQSQQRLKSQIKKLEEAADPVLKNVNEGYKLPRKLKAGDEVLIFDIDKKATVLEVDNSNKNALVQAGIIKTRVPMNNLRLISGKNKVKSTSRSVTRNIKSNIDRDASTQIDLRGMNAIEAVMELDNFIDSSLLLGINHITIIHGKGTGVLRKEIQAHLKKHPSIKSYRLGVFGEGESGVTIAELK